MKKKDIVARVSAAALAAAAAGAMTSGVRAQALAGVAMHDTPQQHCGESCTSELLANRGDAVDPETGREFFLDFPCDLAVDEKVVFILSIHGAGSIGNWQRHYFPALDFKDEYRLVIATPTAAGSGTIGPRPVRMWTADTDDAHLRNIVNLVTERFGRENIRAFWLAGHSQGGITSNRIVCTDFFRDKVDGWLNLSGGRIGRAEIAPDFFGPDGPPPGLASADPNAPRPGVAVLPECDISYIFTSGEHEIVALPETSPMAEVSMRGPRTAGRRRRRAEGLRDRGCARARCQLGPGCAAWHRGSVRLSELRGRQARRRRSQDGQGPHRGARARRHGSALEDDGRCARRQDRGTGLTQAEHRAGSRDARSRRGFAVGYTSRVSR